MLVVSRGSLLSILLALHLVNRVYALPSIPPLCETTEAPLEKVCGVLPRIYAHVSNEPAPIYRTPYDAMQDIPPVRYLDGGSIWVSLYRNLPVKVDGKVWYEINKGEYVEASHLTFAQPSQFKGIEVPQRSGYPFAWLILDTTPSPTPGASPDYQLQEIPRYSLVTLYDTEKVGKWNWYKIGEDNWIEQRRVGVVIPSERPERIGKNEKWIDVNLYEQTLAAYEGDRMVYATLISSGVKQFPTVEGLFRIWAKVDLAKMSGGKTGDDYYFLEDIPWHMYFYHGYALHAAYWHDNFGFRQSHGCINLSPLDAKWLFDWTTPQSIPGKWVNSSERDPGTWVRIHR